MGSYLLAECAIIGLDHRHFYIALYAINSTCILAGGVFVKS